MEYLHSRLRKDLLSLVHQFLKKNDYHDALHTFEMESGLYFNVDYFQSLLQSGKWQQSENYLASFTSITDNEFSALCFLEIRQQRFLEESEEEKHNAFDIIFKDADKFAAFNDGFFNDLVELKKLREFSTQADLISRRNALARNLKHLTERNPILKEKINNRSIPSSRLQTLINQSLNSQYYSCNTCSKSKKEPDMQTFTLYADHYCLPQIGTPPLLSASNHHAFTEVSQSVFSSPMAAQMFSNNQLASNSAAPAVIHPPCVPCQCQDTSKRITPPRREIMNEKFANFQHMNQPRGCLANKVPEATGSGFVDTNRLHSLPLMPVVDFTMGAAVTSMSFHPLQPTILLVGESSGDVTIWDISLGKKLFHDTWRIWRAAPHPLHLQALKENADNKDVKKCVWSPDGYFFGVAFAEVIVHIYTYGHDSLHQLHELEAHIVNVNDIEFAPKQHPLLVVTCGSDGVVKVWNVISGQRVRALQGSEGLIHSITTQTMEVPRNDIEESENILVIFAIDMNGWIKAWFDGDLVYERCLIKNSYCRLAYSADRSRLFLYGTRQEGKSFLYELSESEGTVLHNYKGIVGKGTLGHMQFDNTQNRLLAAGNNNQIKFWDINDCNMLHATNVVDGCLPENPCVRFNNDGSLLAVTTTSNRITILANYDGFQLLSTQANMLYKGKWAVLPEMVQINACTAANAVKSFMDASQSSMINANALPVSGLDGNARKNVNFRQTEFIELTDPAQCRSVKLQTDEQLSGKVLDLFYVKSGNALLSLDDMATHRLWKLQQDVQNPPGKVSTKGLPRLEITKNFDSTMEEAAKVHSSLALMNNDCYILSASGGKCKLLNIEDFKIVTEISRFPSVTCLAAYHTDNIVAIGLENSTIVIFDLHKKEIIKILEGHQQRITGLAFSKSLNVLVSAGADSQVCIWSVKEWKEQRKVSLSQEEALSSLLDTRVQFHGNQLHMLLVQKHQIAIYDAATLNFVSQWAGQKSNDAPISNATYSCDGQLVYVAFSDGKIGIFGANPLKLTCCISTSAYMKNEIRDGCGAIDIASHPELPYQFAVGMSEGSIYVIEPTESERSWFP